MGDVSPTQVLVTINGRIKVYDRAGNLGSLNADLDVFFNSVRNGAGISDPRCRWDRLTNRWMVLAINIASTNNRIVIGVSNGPTITDTSSFTFYQYSHNVGGSGTDEGRFLDYPSLGVDKNALYVGGNVFSSNGGFWNTSVHVIRKSSILNGGPIVVTPFRGMLDTNDGYLGMYTPQGVDNDDPNATAGYFIAIDGKTYGTLYARKVSNPGGTPTLGPNLKLTVPTTSGPTDVPHLGSTNKLSAIDERLLVAKINRNALTGETSLWTSHHITTSSFGVAVNGGSTGGRTGVRWYEIRGYDTGTLSLRQSGTVFDSTVSNPNFFWMPSVVSTLQGHTVMGASRSSSLVYAGIGKTYRLAGDGLGFMNQPLKVVDGVDSFNIQSGTQRWGDYSHTVVDPADGMSVWTFQEYVSAKNQFGVRVLKLQAPPPAKISSVSPNSSDPGKTVDLTVTGDTANGTGFFDPGAGYTGRLAASFNGSGVTVSQVSFVSPSKITVTAVIGDSASGAYELTVTNPDGQTVKLASALTVNPAIALSGVSLPTTINAGSSVSGSVTLTAAAPTAGISVALTSGSTALTVPATVTVASGATSATFTATAGTVAADTDVTVTGSYNGVSKSATTKVVLINVASVTLTPASVVGGSATGATATVTLNRAAGSGGVTVSLASNRTTLASVPASVVIPEGATSADVPVATPLSVAAATTVKITATYQGASVDGSLRINPPGLESVTLNPTTLVGGTVGLSTGTITLNANAPTGGTVVTLSSSDATLTEFSAPSVTVPAGSKTVTFTVRAAKAVPVTKTVSVVARITASKSVALTISAPRLTNFRLSRTTVVGGSTTVVNGTVTLNGPAPTGGTSITITSSNSSAASAPATVVVPEGATTGTFRLTTFKVSANTAVTFTVKLDTVTKTANITVTP
jgi:hypothetical protein